jgi:hypothetical protein
VRRLSVLVLLAASAPTIARAGEVEVVPWGKRRASLGVGAGASISSSLTVVASGIRGGYFVADGLELGAEIDLGVLLWSAADFTAHPGLARTAPNLALRVTPTVRYVFLRQPGFSPYLLAGAGPTWWNHIGGAAAVAGHWTASPGALIYLGGRIYLDLAIRFSGSFPGRSCHRAFTVAGAEVAGYCGFQFGPRLGFALAF